MGSACAATIGAENGEGGLNAAGNDCGFATFAGFETVYMSTVTLFECRSVVLRRLGGEAEIDLTALMHCLGVVRMTFDEAQAALAFDAYR